MSIVVAVFGVGLRGRACEKNKWISMCFLSLCWWSGVFKGSERGVRTYLEVTAVLLSLHKVILFFMCRLKLQEWTRCCQICTSRAVHSRSVLHKQTNR